MPPIHPNPLEKSPQHLCELVELSSLEDLQEQVLLDEAPQGPGAGK